MESIDEQDITPSMSTGPALDQTPNEKYLEQQLQGRSSDERSSSDQPTDGLLKESGDVEAQKDTSSSTTAVEHTVSMKSKLSFLGAYFLLNLALTLSNKAVLGHVRSPTDS